MFFVIHFIRFLARSIKQPSAWGNEDTSRILEILAKHDVHVTFFMTGGWMNKYPDDVKAILAGGHDLGNHSQNHKQMSTLSLAECKEELTEPHEYIKELTGEEMILFRPPYGDYNDTVIQAADECSYYTIQWDVDSLDWKDLEAGEITRRVTSKVQPGSIVLFHNAALHTPEALPGIIQTLLQEGYTFVPISQIILTGDYTIDHTGRQCPAKGDAA